MYGSNSLLFFYYLFENVQIEYSYLDIILSVFQYH